MPEELDPQWEYWEPDSEIAELFAMSVASGFDLFGVDEERIKERGWNIGIRFGRGNPDKCWFRLAPGRKVYREEKRQPIYECQKCGCGFSSGSRKRIVYCTTCVPTRGSPRLLGEGTCKHCSKVFPIRQSRYSQFCSSVCGSKYHKKVEYEHGCPICGCEVIRSGKGRSNAKVYCGRRCQHIAVQRRSRR